MKQASTKFSDDGIRVHVLDSHDICIFSNLLPNDIPIFSACTSKNIVISVGRTKIRHGKVKTPLGTLYLISENQKMVKSSRIFLEKQSIWVMFLWDIIELRKNIFKDYNHDMPTIHGHNIQEIFALIPQADFQKQKNAQEQINFIKNIVETNPEKAARMLLKVIKNNSSISNEFTILGSMYSERDIKQIETHKIYKVLHNTLVNFFIDFKDIRVFIDIQETDSDVDIDYITFNGALVPFFENAVKYVLPDEEINIFFTTIDSQIVINIKMTSVQIKGDERNKIFQEGFSGEVAKKNKKSGNGLGLFRTKTLLQLSNARIEVIPNFDPPGRKFINGVQYEVNLFKIFVKGK